MEMGYFVSQSLSVILLLMLCNRRQETAAPSPNQARRSPATMFSPSRCSMGRLMGIEMVVFLGIMMVMVMVMMMVMLMTMLMLMEMMTRRSHYVLTLQVQQEKLIRIRWWCFWT